MSMLTTTQRQEPFSNAYVRAVVAAAGCAMQGGPDPDTDSVDFSIRSDGGSGRRRGIIDVQLKSKLCEAPPTGDFSYDLKAKNYEELRIAELSVPRILVLVMIPKDVGRWLEQTPKQLLMRYCAWWVSLCGQGPRENSSTVRILVPGDQRFDVPNLLGLMERSSLGEAL